MIRTLNTFFLGAVLIAAPVLLTSCDDDDDSSSGPGNIVENVQGNNDLSTLEDALGRFPDLVTTLSGNGEYTVFAPTNAAFSELLTSLGATSLADVSDDDLRNILEYHVLGSEVEASDIASGSSMAETLNGTIYLSKTSGVFINGTTQVTTADVDASNGVVHIINKVLLPPSQTIAEIAVAAATASSPQFSQLVAALSRTQGQGANDLLAAVSSAGSNLTVFAPTDAAFQELYTALGVSSVDEIPLETLIAVLKHHVVSGRVFSTDLSNGAVTTLNGNVTVNVSAAPPTITGGSGQPNVADLQTSLLNIHATNGVVHVIDQVLLP